MPYGNDERFWSKVDIFEDDECWPWNAATRSSSAGPYGRIWCPQEQRPVQATYYLVKYVLGNIPGTVQMHTCDNTVCCNPAHVIPATQLENMRDMVAKGRHFHQRETCKRGHNRWSVSGARKRRRCLDCRKIYG